LCSFSVILLLSWVSGDNQNDPLPVIQFTERSPNCSVRRKPKGSAKGGTPRDNPQLVIHYDQRFAHDGDNCLSHADLSLSQRCLGLQFGIGGGRDTGERTAEQASGQAVHCHSVEGQREALWRRIARQLKSYSDALLLTAFGSAFLNYQGLPRNSQDPAAGSVPRADLVHGRWLRFRSGRRSVHNGGMARIKGLKKGQVGKRIAKKFDQQTERWGAPLEPYELYARRPTIFQAVVGMWGGLAAAGLLDGGLTALVNRRVASLNGCVF